MKKIAIMQPYLLPYLGYFQLIQSADQFVIYDDVQYIKGGWINRNNLLIHGNKNLFNIMLDHASPNKLINQIDISDNFIKLQKTIGMAYKKAPYSEAVTELLSRIFAYQDKNLARFTGNSLEEIAKYLKIDTQFIYSSTLQKNNDLKAQDKVIAICKELEASEYINSIGGQDLYKKTDFERYGIKLSFIKSHDINYKQFNNDFIPSLSIIDVMMFNSPEEISKMLDDYELI